MNRYWLIFLSFVALVSLWHTGKMGHQLYTYYTLSQKTKVSSMKITPEEFAFERFGGKAHYAFSVGGKAYQGEDFLQDVIYRNQESMEAAIPSLEARKWDVWYQPSNPDNSALYKTYPYKEMAYSIILWGLLFYFIRLGYYFR